MDSTIKGAYTLKNFGFLIALIDVRQVDFSPLLL
jgi:hypothetical protein